MDRYGGLPNRRPCVIATTTNLVPPSCYTGGTLVQAGLSRFPPLYYPRGACRELRADPQSGTSHDQVPVFGRAMRKIKHSMTRGLRARSARAAELEINPSTTTGSRREAVPNMNLAIIAISHPPMAAKTPSEFSVFAWCRAEARPRTAGLRWTPWGSRHAPAPTACSGDKPANGPSKADADVVFRFPSHR